MLKIRDEIDLKILEKYGFRKEGKYYRHPENELLEIEDRYLYLDGDCCLYCELYMLDMVYDLIKDGILEKI